MFWTDFLVMVAGFGCSISSAITLVIFFPRSIEGEIAARDERKRSSKSGHTGTYEASLYQSRNEFTRTNMTHSTHTFNYGTPVLSSKSFLTSSTTDAQLEMDDALVRVVREPGRTGSTDKYSADEEQDAPASLPPLRPNRKKGDDVELGSIEQTIESSVAKFNARPSNVNRIVHNFTSPIDKSIPFEFALLKTFIHVIRSAQGEVVLDIEHRPSLVIECLWPLDLAQNFNDDGSVKEICLEGNSCLYIHPSHPEWKKANPYSQSSDGDRGVDKTTFRKAYRKMIRYTEDAVRIQIELDAAKKNLSRWKRTQSSRIYAHSGPSTRQFLDTRRKNYAQTVSDLQKQLSHALSVLSKISCGHEHQFSSLASRKLDDNDFQLYIDELNQWIESLRHLIPQPVPPGTEDPSKWTWGEIEASVVVLNDLCEKFAELSLMKRHTDVESDHEIDDGMTGESAGTNKGTHDARAREVLKLQQRIIQDGEELVRLRAKLQDLEDLQSQMQKRLETYTRWAKEDTTKIQVLSERVKLLYMLPNPAVQLPDDVLEATSEFVVEESKKIVVGYLRTLVALCVTNNNALLEEVDGRFLGSMKELTEAIYERATGSEASDNRARC
ncbi:hypothetical protein C0995_008637 [Termitomyces sp. Mi166|nr:hypothetical protein C0995_008637 [Termitomyces sp. Mi166\